MKKSHIPLYLTQNRLGIFYFQYRIPSKLQLSHNQTAKQLFRKSLKTKNQSEAVFLSRYYWLIMNTLNKKYFNNPTLYGKAMELLMRYESIEMSDWDTVDKFLLELDSDESELLELAIKQTKEDSHDKQEKIDYLEKLLSQINKTDISHSSTALSKDNPLVSELVSSWLKIKKDKLTTSSYQTLEPRINLFVAIVSEILSSDKVLIGHITPEVLREYKNLIEKLPANRNKRGITEKSFKELSESDLKKISSQTFLYNLDTTKEFLNWAKLEGYAVDNKLEGILQIARKNSTKKITTQRVPFSDEDLRKIFSTDNYIKGKSERASDYWVPLIALFTGARLGEICQLLINDIQKIDDTWCFVITDEGDEEKRIKAKGSERIVPIHSKLIDLGLIDYKNALLNHSHSNLFPDEIRDKSGRFSAIQKRFNHQFKKLEFETNKNESKVFHSFRHLVRTRLTELSINEGLIDSIVGHTSKERSIGSKFYTHTQLVLQKSEAIEKLVYKISFDAIKNWNQCRFGRNLN